MLDNRNIERIRALAIWQGSPEISPLSGGMTNVNFLVQDAKGKFVVRLGADILEHQIMRFNELSASRAAHAAGISPKVVFAEEGLTVLEFIESHTFSEQDVRQPENLSKIVELLKKCHTDIAHHLRGPALMFWVFHVIRDYGATLDEAGSGHGSLVSQLVEIGNQLEREAEPFTIAFCHNDLLAANILDDGERLWLIDWDYAGFNSPLFDLGGLASNSGFDATHEGQMLEMYFETPLTDEFLRKYHAMKCASLLRETMWSMVSEVKSDIQFDYATYTENNLARFRSAYDLYSQG